MTDYDTAKTAARILRQHGVNPNDPVSIAARLRLLEERVKAWEACYQEARVQRDATEARIKAALEAGAEEGCDRYRGTDEPRAWVVALRGE